MKLTQRLNIGEALEGFTLLSHLGEGGFSRVFRVRGSQGELGALKLAKHASPNPYGGGTVALCFAQPIAFHTGGIGPAPLEPNLILEREGMMLKGLADPIFPRLLGHGTLEDRTFLLYEEMTGGSLRERMTRRHELPLQLFVEMGLALAERQQQGRMPFHGDLKPENVMFDASGSWRLIDPSCAVAEGKPLGARTFVTTPAYYPFLMPDDRVALALMVVEALTGVLLTSPDVSMPPRRLTADLQQWLETLTGAGRGRYLQALRCVPRLDELSLQISSELSRVLLKALYLRHQSNGMLDVDRGYASWDEFLAELSFAIERNA